MVYNEENRSLHKRSGEFDSHNKLTSFLYELLRDLLLCGVVEKSVKDSQTTPVYFTNGYLAKYSEDLAKRLEYNHQSGIISANPSSE